MQGINLNNRSLDRRGFIAASAAAAAALGASGALYGCDSRVEEVDPNGGAGSAAEWKTIACLHGCGTRCVNQVLVQDGVVIRQKTDDSHADSIEFPQQRGCLRGRTLVESEMGVDRIKYPLKRISWSPENPNGELRGVEGYERISWDEALDYVAEQLRRVYTEFGPRSVLAPVNLSNGRACYGPLLNTLGGYLAVSDSISYGTYTANTDLTGLNWGGEGVNDRLDVIENADVVVLLGQNPAWSSQGNPAAFFRAAADHGAQMAVISPVNNATSLMLGARWIPVNPGGDTALLIGVAGEMLRQDAEAGNIVDWDFLHTYCMGFDDESMPEDAATTENYKGYLEGKYDGAVKDAAWASKVCGTPEEDIIWLAKALSKQNNVVLSHGYAAARCNGAEDLPQAYMALACMGGHFGKPGNTCGNYYCDRVGPLGVQIISTGDDGTGAIELPENAPLYDPNVVEGTIADDYVDGLEIWDAVINGTYQSIGRCWSGVFNKPVQRDCDIRVIFGGRDGSARSNPATSKMPEAMRKVDFVCIEHYTVTPSLPYADIILPILANIEQDGVSGNGDRDREAIQVYSKLAETTFEAKSEQWVAEQLLERLGYDPKTVYPLSEQQRYFNKLANSTVNDPEGNPTPLVTITADDIATWGVEGQPQEGVIALEELRKKGAYQVERTFGDGYAHVAYKEFIDDPATNPLPSASGLFEFYCQAKADQFNEVAFAGEEYKPYPTYHPFDPTDEYPMLMFNTHYPRSACSDFDNTQTLREAWSAPVTVSTVDAEAAGLVEGDAVLVSSPYGKIVRPVTVSSLIIPGAVDVPNGTWPRFGEDGIDYGGCPNTLYGGKPYGMGVSGYNNVPVKIEKWTGAELVLDCDTTLALEVQE